MKFSVSCLILLHVTTVFALILVEISVPSVIQAETPTNASLSAEVHAYQITKYAYALRVYLASSMYGKIEPGFYHSECYLIHEQSLCDPTIEFGKKGSFIAFNNTPFTITIPATVGPSAKTYVLAARVMNTDGSYWGAQMFSKAFELTGANGTWAKYQQRGSTLWGDDGIACTGLTCVKDCADAHGNGTAPYSFYQGCINSCPGVSVDPKSSRGGDPTAALVEPSTCPSPLSTSATVTASGGISTGSTLRTGAVAGQTGATASGHRHNVLTSLVFATLILAVILG